MQFDINIERFNDVKDAFINLDYFQKVYPHEKNAIECLERYDSLESIDIAMKRYVMGSGYSELPRYGFFLSPKGLTLQYTLFSEVEFNQIIGRFASVDWCFYTVFFSKGEISKIWRELKIEAI